MKALLRILLVLTLLTLLGGATVFGAMFLGYTMETALIAFGLVIGVIVFCVLLYRFIIRHRAKKRVEKLINIQSPSAEEKQDSVVSRNIDLKAFDARFKSVIKFLRRSKMGNSAEGLYSLPWFLMIGTESSKKSTVISSARLTTPSVEDQSLKTKDGGTDWWLYNEAVMIDTAPDYVSGNKSRPEWHKLLQLLGKFREREPVNGVVVTVSISDLLNKNNELLHESGKDHRRLLDELMLMLKISVPVYLVVSECDQLHGFSDWSRDLPEKFRFSPIGVARESNDEARSFIGKATLDISERIKELMLLLVKEGDVNSAELKLPYEIENIKEKLMAFSGGLFQPSAYQETPNLRGLYLVGEQQLKEKEQVRHLGLFSQHLFTRILPKDRRVISSLTFSDRAHAWFRRLALSGWGVGIAALLLTIGTTYYRHADYLQQVHKDYAGKLVRQASIDENIYALNKARKMIVTLSDSVNGWWMPWFTEFGEPAFIEKIKYTYTERVQEEILVRINKGFNRELEHQLYSAKEKPDDEMMANYVTILSRRINVLLATIDGEPLEKLQAMPKPFSNEVLFAEMKTEDDVVDQLNNIYLHALVWTKDETLLRNELSILQDALVGVLRFGGDELKWVISWGKEQVRNESISLRDYWRGSGPLTHDVTIDGVFTLKGREQIDNFLVELQKTDPESARLPGIIENFREYYFQQYMNAWATFANEFNRGLTVLKGRDEWLSEVEKLGTVRNPYVLLMDKMQEQVLPILEEIAEPPKWAALIARYQLITAETKPDVMVNTKRNKALTSMGLKAAGAFGSTAKALAKKAKGVLKNKKKLDKASAGGEIELTPLEVTLEDSIPHVEAYRTAIIDMAYNAKSRPVSYRAMKKFFGNPDPTALAGGDSAEDRLHSAIQELQKLHGYDTRETHPFWAILSGPLTLTRFYMVEEAACHLQDRWTDEFMTAIDGVPNYKLPQLIYGEGSLLKGFMDQDARPFARFKYRAGYVPVKANGMKMPLTTDFLEFASRGEDGIQAKQDIYNVEVKALPTSANPEAKFHPSETVLTLKCPDGNIKLENYNFPNRKTFGWNDSCTGVELSIKINRMKLVESYDGPLAFPNFLKDFNNGEKRYYAAKFPAYIDRLEEYGISHIDVKFDIRGAQAVTDSLKTLTLSPPDEIATCWKPGETLDETDFAAFTYE